MNIKSIQKKYEKRVQECINLFDSGDKKTAEAKVDELKKEVQELLNGIIHGFKTGETKQHDQNIFMFYAMLSKSINYVDSHLGYNNDDDLNTQATIDHFQGALSACQREYKRKEESGEETKII